MGIRWKNLGAYERGRSDTTAVKAKTMYRMRIGDFVFNRIDTDKGAFSVVGSLMDGSVASNEFPAYRCVANKLIPEYLWLYFQQPEVLASLRPAGSDGRARWKEADFERHILCLPPLEEQQRIVDLIGSLDDAIEAAELNVHTASNAMQEFLCGVVCAEVKNVPVSAFCNIVYGKKLKAPDRDGGRRRVYGAAGSIGSHSSDTTNGIGPVMVIGRKGVDSRGYLRLPLRTTPRGISRWGGAGSINYSDDPIWVIDTAFQVHLKEGIDARAAYWSLVLANLPSVCTTTTLPGLNRDTALASPAPDPTTMSSDSLGVLDMFESSIAAQIDQLTSLRTLRSELLTVLLSGEHEIQESYDAVTDSQLEPAA